MSETLFWHLMGALLLVLGATSLLTAGLLRARRQAWRVPLAYGAMALIAALALLLAVR